MPFKFHLKKSRQYNVVSKNQYVICIELLDTTSIECTLSIDSLGQECLDNVTQRLGLGQPEFFGLRYISRHDSLSPRWVDMDKPLKKQLEKEAKSFSLYLRVMYYVTDVQLIQDEMTRYIIIFWMFQYLFIVIHFLYIVSSGIIITFNWKVMCWKVDFNVIPDKLLS